MFKIYKGGDTFFQWDIGQRLIVEDPEMDKVHFCNKTGECSLVCEVYEEDGLRLVNVPNILLQVPYMIRVYGCLVENEDSYFAKNVQIFKVIARTKPEDYVYTEEELKNWTNIGERIAILEEDIEVCEEDIEDIKGAIVEFNLATKPELEAVSNRLETAIADSTLDSDTELLDMRTGADGTTYSTAGTAVRTQIQDLKDTKFEIANITDTTGDSEEKVMSQKATTKNLTSLDMRVSKNEKRIANLVKGISEDLFVEDNTVAYKKDVPESVLPYAEIGEVGGMSHKCNNLIYFNIANNTVKNGITFTNNTDGSITLNGTATAAISLYGNRIYISNSSEKSFWFSGGNGAAQLTLNTYTEDKTFVKNIGTSTSYSPKEVIYSSFSGVYSILPAIYIALGAKFNNVIIKPMANFGETALPYMPYFTGLKDAKVTAIESEGRSLFPASDVYGSWATEANRDGKRCFRFVTNTDHQFTPIEFKANTQYTVRFNACAVKKQSDANGSDWVMVIIYTDGTKTTIGCQSDSKWRTITKTSTANKTIKSIGVVTNEYRIDNYIEIDSFIFVEGTEIPEGTKPYFKNTFAIPEEVQALEGYGQGVNGECCSKIVFDSASGKAKFICNTRKKVFDGTESIQKGSSGTYTYYLVYGGKQNNIVSNLLPTVAYSALPTTTGISNEYDGIYFNLGTDILDGVNYENSVDGVKAYLKAMYDAGNPLTVISDRTAPVETDVTEYFTQDNLIGVEANGRITAVNEYKLDAPSIITYQLKEV